MEASKREIAVYALQHSLKVNWFDLDPGYDTIMEQEYTDTEYPQIWLERLLQNPESLEKLKEEWRNRYMRSIR